MLAAMRRTVLAALVAGLALTAAAAAQSGEDARAAREPLRVLFVGNSLTATNDLPAIVAALGAAAKRVPIEYATVAPGGVNLEDHWTFTGARDALLARPWDVVVLQQGRPRSPRARSISARGRSAGPSWRASAASGRRCSRSGPRGRAPTRSRRSSARIAPPPSRRGRRSCPAGSAWLAAWRRAPRLALYGPDDFHPSVLGSTLAALVVYARLTGTPPSAVPLPFGARTTRILRQAAADALR